MNVVQFQKKLLSIQQNMMNFAMMLTSNVDDAHDLMQETTLKVLNNQKKFVNNTNFKGWVLTIMRNIFINSYHKVVRTHTVCSHYKDARAEEVMGQETPENIYWSHEINDFINKLSDEHRNPLVLHISGYTYSEIADRLDLPLGTVKSRIFFARKKLRSTLSVYRKQRIK